MSIRAGLSFMYEDYFLDALYQLFEHGELDALEWSFDTLLDIHGLPEKHARILRHFSNENALYGHGVFYSPMAAKWLPKHQNWIDKLPEYLSDYQFCHLSEHFAFMSSSNAHDGMPLPFYVNDAIVDVTVNRMRVFAEQCGVPVGLENLAFAFCEAEIEQQANCLKKVLEPINGFALLDLHNIYCQAMNFDIPMQDIINLYPLERVKEIHISGGSWQRSEYSEEPLRRDTHSHAVPGAVMEALETTLPQTPNVDLVLLERMGYTVVEQEHVEELHREYRQLKEILKKYETNPTNSFTYTLPSTGPTSPIDNAELYQLQTALLAIFENHSQPEIILEKLRETPGLNQLMHADDWELRHTDMALKIMDVWGVNA